MVFIVHQYNYIHFSRSFYILNLDSSSRVIGFSVPSFLIVSKALRTSCHESLKLLHASSLADQRVRFTLLTVLPSPISVINIFQRCVELGKKRIFLGATWRIDKLLCKIQQSQLPLNLKSGQSKERKKQTVLDVNFSLEAIVYARHIFGIVIRLSTAVFNIQAQGF